MSPEWFVDRDPRKERGVPKGKVEDFLPALLCLLPEPAEGRRLQITQLQVTFPNPFFETRLFKHALLPFVRW